MSSVGVSALAFLARESLRLAVERVLTRIWPEERAGKAALLPMATRNEDVYDQIDALAPKDDRQRALQSRAMSLMLSMGQMRWQTSARYRHRY